MPEPIATPPPLPHRQKTVTPEPGLLRAWRGIWSFTWRSHLAWRRAPMLAVTLLAIPLLTFFTLEPLKLLTTRYDWRTEPRNQANEFKAIALSADARLPRGIGTRLTQIIAEEQNRIQTVEPPAPGTGPAPFSEETLNRQIEEARACHDAIQERARPLLDGKQFALFREFEEGKLEHAIETIKKFNLEAARPFYHWLVDFYFLLVLPLYCLSVCGSMMRDEVQGDTLGFLTTRPVSRARLFLLKFFCQLGWLQLLATLHGLLLFGAGLARQAPGAGDAMGLFFATQFLGVLAWGALSAALGLVTRRYMVLGVVYGFVVEMGIGRIPTNINVLSLTRHLQALLGRNPLLNQLYDWAPQGAWFSVGMLLLATAVFLSVATALFTYREYHSATEMQK